MDKKEIKHIADIAQIHFSDEELEEFEEKFNENLVLIEKIKEVNTEGIDEVSQVNGTENNFREDEISESLSEEEALENAPSKKYGYFKLIKFVE